MNSRFLSALGLSTDAHFLRSSSIVFIGSTLVNALNYFFTLVVARLLGPASFGEVAALSGFFIILSVPGSTITTFMAKQGAAYKSEGRMASVRHLVAFLDRWSFTLGLILLGIFLACLPLVSRYLGIPNHTLIVFSALIPLSFVSAVSTGALQGLQAFKFLQYQNVSTALVKFIAAVALIYSGFSVPGVMLALALSVAWSLVYGFLKTVKVTGPMGFFSAPGESDAAWASMRGYLALFFANALLLAILPNIDVVMAKHYLSAFDAGQYGALSTIGKILLYGVAAFTTVLLPVASEAHAQGSERGRKALRFSVGIVSAAAVACIAVFTIRPILVIRLLFGAAYVGVAPYLALFALAMYFVALATVFVNYFLATHQRAFIWSFLAAIIVQVGSIAAWHASLAEIVRVMVGSTGFLAFLMLLNYLFASKTPKPAYAQ